jgi:hypothetical protein
MSAPHRIPLLPAFTTNFAAEQAPATSKTFQTLGKRTIRATAANNFLTLIG